MIYENYIHTTLYLNITSKCQMGCNYCQLGKGNEVASLGDMIKALETIRPELLVITGGEPLLYPDLLLNFLKFYEVDYKKHWDIILCSSLLYDTSKDKVLEVLNHIDDLQYTYSLDRINKIGKDIFISRIKEYRSNVRNILSIITLTEDVVNKYESEEEIKGYIEEALQYTDKLGLELLSYDSSIDYITYQNKADRFIGIAFKYIPKDKNVLLHKWETYYNSSLSVNCNSCDIGCAYTMLPNGNIKKQCNCAIDRNTELRKQKFMNMCVNCDIFGYCKVGCERFGPACGFPKNTFNKYLKGDYDNEL